MLTNKTKSHISLYRYIYKNLNYGENFIFLFQKVKPSYIFRLIECKLKHFKSFFSFNFDDKKCTANESQKSVYQNIIIFTFEF